MSKYKFAYFTKSKGEILSDMFPDSEEFKKEAEKPNKDMISCDENKLISILADGISSCPAATQASFQSVKMLEYLFSINVSPYKSSVDEQLKTLVKGLDTIKTLDITRIIETFVNENLLIMPGVQAPYEALNWMKLNIDRLSDILKSKINQREINIKEQLIQIFHYVNNNMSLYSDNIPQYNGWGTTLDSCLIHNDIAHIGHVGDGKVFYSRLGSNCLTQITTDHLEYAPHLENLPPEQRDIEKMRLKLSNHMGIKNLQVDYIEREMQPFDLILMASDGLTKAISIKEIGEIMCHAKDDFKGTKNMITERLSQPSSYSLKYAERYNIDRITATQKLVDDTSVIMIARVE
jgi:serine/threonine protein phosphatase PrpC